jgi:dolichol-phosphate mannosyltransferase
MQGSAHPDVSIVVPAFEEGDNLTELVQRLSTALNRAGRTFEVIVVDDDSHDCTPLVCQALAVRYPLRLIVRKHERGLSSAVIAGLREAAGEVVVVMDADLSHPPEKVPELLRLAEQPQVDFVIGSRYVAGGGTDSSWGLFRRLNSSVATLLARGLTRASDPLAGFFAMRRAAFVAAEGRLDPIGFKIGLELMVKAGSRRVVETPILFANRKRGASKLGLREQLRYVRHLLRLYRYRWLVRMPPTIAEDALPDRRRRAA